MLSQSHSAPFTGIIDTRELLHDVMAYIPYNGRTLTAMRCVSKPFRSAVQSCKGPWAGHRGIMLSRYGQCALFNAQEDETGKSDFQLYSVSPIGRKFRTVSATLLGRYHTLVANGLRRLALHHSHVDNGVFEALKALVHLRELELVSCRSVTAIGDASHIPSLEVLEVDFCPLESDGLRGLSLPRLKRLTLRSCHKLSNLNGITAETATSLEDIHVVNCSVYDDTTDTFFAQLSSNLRTVHLSNTHVDTSLSLIPEAAREAGLRELHLSQTPLRFETLQDIAPSLSRCLEFLSLEGCAELESFEPVGRMQGLRFLDVSGSFINEGLQFITSCSHLELFRMANSQIESIMFLSSLPHLRVLDAPSSALTDYSLMFLEKAPVLDTVVLSNCIFITNVNVLRTCPQIRRVFCGKTGVTDEGIALLGECEHLEEIDLKFTSVTDVNVLADCRDLRSVNVCSSVTSAEGVKALLDRSSIEVIYDYSDYEDLCD